MVKTKIILKGCLTWAALFLMLQECFAQEPNFQNRMESNNMLFRTTHWEVVFKPNINDKAHLTHDPTAKYRLGTSPQLSYEFGVQRVTHIDDHLSLAVGLRLGLVGRNAEYMAPESETGSDLQGDYYFDGPIARERDVMYFSIPAQLEYRFFSKPKRLFFVNAGASLRFGQLNGSSNSDMNLMEVQIGGNKYPFINLNAGGGFAFLLKNLDIFKVGLDINYDPSYIAKGNFTLNLATSYDQGNYKVKGSSIGLMLVYTRTRLRKII